MGKPRGRTSEKSSSPSPHKLVPPSPSGPPPATTTETETTTTSTTPTTSEAKPQPDPELLEGYDFGHGYHDKTPLDYLADPETGVRPGSFQRSKLSGVSYVDLTEGIKFKVIPPVAIWKRGKW